MNKSFWKEKSVLVTGHTGFKGSWLSLWLQSLGSRTIGFSLSSPTDPSLFELADVSHGMESVEGDVRDLEHLKEVFSDFKPEIVIHLAAQSLVKGSYLDPVKTFNTNVIGTVNMLEAVRNTGSVQAVVSVTSDKCYDNREWFWGYRENDRLGGIDPYSSSKACAEMVISAYRNSFFNGGQSSDCKVAVASTRAGNVIGGGDWSADRLIPDIMRTIGEKKSVAIRNPRATRPWQFVLEPLRGYLSLAQELWEHGPEFSEAWNFGPDDEEVRPVGWIAEYLTHRWGGDAKWHLDSDDHPHENTYLKLDCSKARMRLSWKPMLGLSTALDWIEEWYQCFYLGGNIREICLTQIKRYEEACNL